LRALRAVGVPQAFVVVLSMTYRYLFLFLHTVNGMFEARRSRMVGRTGGAEQRAWIAGSMGALLNRSFQLGSGVYAAMLARGFTGEARGHDRFRMGRADWAALGGSVLVCAAVIAAGRLVP